MNHLFIALLIFFVSLPIPLVKALYAQEAEQTPPIEEPPTIEESYDSDTPEMGRKTTRRGAKAAKKQEDLNEKGVGKDDIVVSAPPDNKIPEVVDAFDFKEADVLTLVKAMSRFTGKSFIVSKQIAGKKDITIIGPTKMTVQEAYNLFLSILDANGLATTKVGRFIRIVEKKDIPGMGSLYPGEYYPKNDEYITRIFKLKYIQSVTMEAILTGTGTVGRGGGFNYKDLLKIKAFEDTNTLIVTGPGSKIAEIEQIIALLDTKGFEYQLEVIKIVYADASKVKDILEKMLFKAQINDPNAASRSRVASSYGGGAERYSQIYVDERTNSIIVLANKPGIEKIRELVQKLDFAIQGDSDIHVYPLKNTKAEEMSATLGNIIGAGKGGGGGGSGVASAFADVKITADKALNALVIAARPKLYESIIKVIEVLDKRKGQVLVETIAMEVSLDDSFAFGVASNYAYSAEIPRAVGFDPGTTGANNSITNYLADPTKLSGLILGFGSRKTVSANFGGKTVTIPSLTAFISALESNTETNVLQRPTVITSDNEQATIKVVDKIPMVKGSTMATGVGTTQNVEMQEVGLKLMITPHINETSEFVKLELEQDTSNVTDRAPKGLTDTTISTNERSIKTSIVVKDNDTVVLGGLYRDDQTVIYKKVPILGDIPLIGWLFKGKSTSNRKTNLLVFITPHVVRNYDNNKDSKHSELTSDALRSRKGFIKQNTGGDDPFRDVVEAIDRKNKINKDEQYMPDSGIKTLKLN